MITDSPEDTVRTLGRPNKITRATIVETAVEIGLENVTMSAVAERLGVSVGALYRHVRNRSELQGLMVQAEFRKRLIPRDTGQHWADLVREYAEMLFGLFAGNPALVSEYANGGFPLVNEVDMMETYLTAMHRRGFPADQALDLIRDVRAIVIGSAVVTSAMNCSGVDVDRLLDERQAELPMLRSGRDTYRRTVTEPGFGPTLERLLGALAASRHEALPEKPEMT